MTFESSLYDISVPMRQTWQCSPHLSLLLPLADNTPALFRASLSLAWVTPSFPQALLHTVLAKEAYAEVCRMTKGIQR